LVVALAGRYASSSRKHRGRILDEFVAVSGFHRKHAMRLLRAGGTRGSRINDRSECVAPGRQSPVPTESWLTK
jgi:hypothetical protein